MVYTQEQLMKAVREAGRTGQPFSVGEVRAQLGLKSKDKRELKRFRSRLRECLSTLGSHVEKLGPHSYRLTHVAPPVVAKPVAAARVEELAVSAAHAALKERVGITARAAEPTQRTQTVQLTAAERAQALPALEAAGPSLGSRVSAWLARVRGGKQNTAATALSRLALDLQPNASHFQYQWVDGDLRVKRQ